MKGDYRKYEDAKKRASEKDRYGISKEEILRIWNYQCAICNSKKKLEIHHIDGKGSKVNKKERNNSLSNLIILCSSCHHFIEPPTLGLTLKAKGIWCQKRIPKCLRCGTIKRKHWGKGLCLRCYELTRREYKRNYFRQHYALDKTIGSTIE